MDTPAMLAFLFWDPYFWVTIPGMLLAMWAQFKLSSTYNRYAQVGTGRRVTGAQAARHILDRNGLQDVEIYETPGHLTDHYDPSKRTVFLSQANYHEASLAAVGVAAHEVGHAIQHKLRYGPLGLRMAMVGVTNFASKISWLLIMGGFLLASASKAAGGGLGHKLLVGGIGLFSLVVFFQLVTLPVEYDASRRAKVELDRLGLVLPDERGGVARVLNAAALTYVAAMVTAMLELLRLVLLARSFGSSDNDR